jgi:hypothetical protein
MDDRRILRMFDEKTFNVEHALSMYATSYVFMPASEIYNEEVVRRYATNLTTCHIYAIGLMPKVEFVGVREENGHLVTSHLVSGEARELRWPMPPGGTLAGGEQEGWYVSDSAGERTFPSEEAMVWRLNSELNAVTFEVLYIGQAYGKDGSRNALDRLLKHETLQKISLQGFPDSHRLNLLFLEIQPTNSMITVFNPFAKDKEQGAERISKGLDKLFNTDEAERITLYEASLIRYFQPKYNKEFKNSFPSTNMKVLADCYDKDFAALVAEICIDELPFKMFTDAVPPSQYHIAKHDLHDQAARKMFFS